MNTSRLILVLTYSCADSAFIHGNPQETVIVDSPESAAITLFKHQKNAVMYERWSGILYKIDFEEMKIETVSIPRIEFR
ncbi:MAG: hypothetical protein PHN44_01910 [Candidatus Marinimicrobia bacterium]|nr:hypothetical protein [Candidatus Neomarinimicrobiota bacterium]